MKMRKMRIKIYWNEEGDYWEGKFNPKGIRIKSGDTVEVLGEFIFPDKKGRAKLKTH